MATVCPALQEGTGRVAFVASASFEKRCMHVANSLSSQYRADAFVVCRFEGDYELQSLQDVRFDKLRGDLATMSGGAAMILCSLNTYDAVESLAELDESVKALADLGISHVDFDVSTFTKQYILVLLALFDKYLPYASLRILYTPADRYGGFGSRKELSTRSRNVIAVPGFDSFYGSPDARELLVVLLGFEQRRVLNLIGRLKPRVCIPVFQYRRNTHLGAKAIYDGNRELMAFLRSRYDGLVQEEVDGEDPNSTCELLERLYRDWTLQRGHVLLVAPHGSKMQAVGVYQFWSKVLDPRHIGIVYAVPGRYSERDYSGSPIGYVVEFWIRETEKATALAAASALSS